MALISDLFGDLPIPTAYPIQLHVDLWSRANDLYRTKGRSDKEVQQFRLGMSGVVTQYMAADEAGIMFSKSVAKYGAAPSAQERYVQEKSFFDTVVHLAACLEGAHYTAIGVGDALGIQGFELITEGQRRNVHPGAALALLKRLPEAASVADAFQSLQANPHFKYTMNLRKVVFHRGLPGRRLIFTGQGTLNHYDPFGELPGPEITDRWAAPLLEWAGNSIHEVWNAISLWLDHY